MELLDWLHLGIVAGVFCFDTVVGIHALVSKREPRAALSWTALCFLVPILGGMLYILFGVNRIRTRARKLQERGRFDPGEKRDYRELQAELAASHPEREESMAALIRISERVGGRPLLGGNRVQPLHNGDNAYPAMLEAIRNAEHSVYLCSYMFDTDPVGLEFVDALAATAARGVDVRVIVDGVGEYYARGTRVGKLLSARQAVKFAAFLPPGLSPRGLRINLRLHRKILVVDHSVGFTGGINIGGHNMLEDPDNCHPIADMHFRIDGPAVLSLEDVFLEDWYFCTGEPPHFDDCKPAVEPAGEALCRGISDGPNEDFQVLTWILVGALGVARERVQIVTPYFLPDRELLAALTAAALRGVQVDVILPERSNLPPIAWAVQDRLVDVLEYGVRVYYQPPPFSHTKLLVMDEFYVLLGSANLDPRSLRLNFEFNVEVFDPVLAAELSAWFDEIKARSREVTRDDLARRRPLVVLRDSLAKLLSPYL